MLGNVIRFELAYRFRRPATYIYFGLMLAIALFAISTEYITVGSNSGLVKENAPAKLALMMVVLSAIPGFFFSSAIMGVPVLRDTEHRMASLIYSTPMSKGAYIWGRFMGSFLTLLFVFSGMLLGFMLGPLMPWIDPEKYTTYALYPILYPFLIFAIPNAFISGALFFMGGTLSRKLMFVFVQGVALLTCYMIAANLIAELDNRNLVAMLDPMGINTLQVISQYWTITQQNSEIFSLSGLLLANRLLWLGLGIAALLITYVGFRFSVVGKGKRKRRRKASAKRAPAADEPELRLPLVRPTRGLSTQLQQVLSLSRLYFREITRSLPFLTIAGFGIVMLIVNANDFNTLYGTDTYPTTYQVLSLISEFNLFFIILIVFYTGELIWRERDLNMNQVYDSLPFPNFVGLAAKFFSLLWVHIFLLLALMLTGILIQVFKGYFIFEIGVYLGTLFSDTLIFLLLFTFLGLFIHVLVNQKFLGHALMVLFFFTSFFILDQMGIEHNLFHFGEIGLGTYSDMNVYGHYVSPFSWFSLYWLGFALSLFALSVLLANRGTEALLTTRLKLARQRFSRPLILFSMTALILFAGSGCYIYYNTNVLNRYQNSDERKATQAEYEQQLKQYEDLPQPKIVATNLQVDIYPEGRDFTVEGKYVLKNKHQQPIATLHVQHSEEAHMQNEWLNLTWLDSSGTGSATVSENFPDFRYTIYELNPPLAPGDSLQLHFRSQFQTTGFVEGSSNTQVIYNGTFFNNTYFPSLGYNEGFELGDDDDRKDYDLPKKERMRPRNDSIGQHINLVGDDADHIRFEVTLSTTPDQIAIAPGYLQREWTEEGRRFFHYKMDEPMFNFYSIVSARYEVMREKWNLPNGKEINLEIYHHPGHTYNLDRMMEGMKHSLRYYSEHFSDYQYRQMRILEFPRYATFAQSFANTVPFSEGIGFILNIGGNDVDMAYYVTAHEMAHQWWGHQVTEAQVRGNAMLSETMSQYSALMVMKEKYPPEMMQKFLRFELDRYLRGRRVEQKKEMPLELVESQGYIHYRKGSLVMYAMQDYLSEDSVNAALRRYVQDWAWRTDRYVTTDILLDYFRAITPDSLSYLITDLFETITLYENRSLSASARSLGDDRYQLDLEVNALKYRADSLGNETEIPFSDWIDIGVLGLNATGEDTLLYLQKHRIQPGKNEFQLQVKGEPVKAGIDPINILIDRNPEDNVTGVERES